MWQVCSDGQTWSHDFNFSRSICRGYAKEYKGYDGWGQALEKAEGFSFADYDDWRVPNVKELQSIVNYEKYDPAISTDVFPNTKSFNRSNRSIAYWSSTPASENKIYVVRFINGMIYADKYSDEYPRYLRLVRDDPQN